MTTEEVLDVIKQKISQAIQEVGGEIPLYPDDFLLKFVKTANFHLSVLGVETGVVVGSVSITPDPSTIMGMLLASEAAASLIDSDVLSRLKNGGLGVSFSSGATAISTNQAAINLKGSSDNIRTWHSLLLTAYLSKDLNSVSGRNESSNASS